MKKQTTIPQSLLKFLFVSLALSFLSSCTSTTQFATRKYTRGHFSDPIAKIKTEHTLSSVSKAPVIVMNQPQTVETETSLPQVKQVKPVFKAFHKQGLNFGKQLKTALSAVAKNPIDFIKDNVSFITSSDYVTGHYTNSSSDDTSDATKAMIRFLICLGIGLLMLVIGFAAGLDSDTAGILIGLSITVFIVALVFLVFWIAALANEGGSRR